MSMNQLQFSYARSGSFTPLPLGAFVGGLDRHGARHMARLARQHAQGGEISALAEEEGREALSRGAALRAHDARRRAERPSRRRAWAQRPCRVACADFRFSQLCDRRAVSVDSVYRPRRQYQRAQRVARLGEAESLRRRQLAAPLRRGLAGRALCVAAGNERLRHPARHAMARLRAARRSRPRRNPAHGAIIPPCPTRSPLPAKRRRRARPRWFAPWSQTRAIRWRWRWRVWGATASLSQGLKPHVLSGCQPVHVS